jgi:hypothetical protein
MLISFFDIEGVVHKEFALAGQAINSPCYSDVLWQLRENVCRLRPELWQQKTWLLHHENPVSTREFLTQNDMNVVPHPSYFPVSPNEDKTEEPPF